MYKMSLKVAVVLVGFLCLVQGRYYRGWDNVRSERLLDRLFREYEKRDSPPPEPDCCNADPPDCQRPEDQGKCECCRSNPPTCASGVTCPAPPQCCNDENQSCEDEDERKCPRPECCKPDTPACDSSEEDKCGTPPPTRPPTTRPPTTTPPPPRKRNGGPLCCRDQSCGTGVTCPPRSSPRPTTTPPAQPNRRNMKKEELMRKTIEDLKELLEDKY